MPDNEKDDFYGVSEEEIEAVRKQRIAREQEADLLLKSAQAIRENGTDMRGIKTPRLDRMRKRRETFSLVTQWLAALSVGAAMASSMMSMAQHNSGTPLKEVIRQEKEGIPFEYEDDFDTSKYLKQLAIIMAPAIFTICLYIGYKKRTEKHEQAAADAANFMLDWAEMGADYAINPKMLKHIMSDRFAREVIAGMSEAEALWFEMLLDGNVELAETPEFKNMAINVMKNYLTRHPEAIVKLLEKYDRDSIPQELMPGHVPTSRSYGM